MRFEQITLQAEIKDNELSAPDYYFPIPILPFGMQC